MADAREIIATKLPTFLKDSWAQEIIDTLSASGYRIIGPDEDDPVTLERAAEAGKEAAKAGDCHHVATAIRALGRKA